MYQVTEVVTWHAVAEIRICIGEYPVMSWLLQVCFVKVTSTCYLYCRVLAKVVADKFSVNIQDVSLLAL
jgi:hypothetical protein